jgi:hypothetical protein
MSLTKYAPPEGTLIKLDMPAEKYHSGPELSASSLGALLRSPSHYMHSPRFFSPAMREGTLFHTAALEPDNWAKMVVTVPDVNWQTTDGKAAAAAWATGLGVTGLPEKPKKGDIIEAVERLGLIFSTGSNVSMAANMALSARQSSWGKQFFSDESRQREVSIFFDAITPDGRKVPFRCRPDLLIPGSAIIDLKKSQDASPEEFARSVAKFGYHRQAVIYTEAVRVATGENLPFLFCVVENVEPYACAWYTLSDEYLEIGRAEVDHALTLFADCSANHNWPSYSTELLELVPPSWLQAKVPSDD